MNRKRAPFHRISAPCVRSAYSVRRIEALAPQTLSFSSQESNTSVDRGAGHANQGGEHTDDEAYDVRLSYLHWFMAACAGACVGLVLWKQNTEDKELKGKLMFYHKSFGLLVLASIVPRYDAYFLHPGCVRFLSLPSTLSLLPDSQNCDPTQLENPEAGSGTGLAAHRFAAGLASHWGSDRLALLSTPFPSLRPRFQNHFAFYGMLLFLPLSGVAMGYFGGKGLPFFFTTIPGASQESKNGDVAKWSYMNHKKVGKVLQYLVPIHVGAVGYHFLHGQNILRRVNPFR